MKALPGAVSAGLGEEASAMPARHEGPPNRLFGQPDEARLLIINADDFGMCHAINAAILRAWQEGIVSSTSLMAPCPWARHALQLLQDHPALPFGVHLTIVCDFRPYRWGPLTARDQVPSLLDAAGDFYPGDRLPELLAQARLAEVEREFRAQIEAVLAAHLTPTHLDWHCLCDGGRADIFDLTIRLAQEYGLALRVHERPMAAQCQRLGLPTTAYDVLDSYSLPTIDKAARYAQLLRALPAGLSEWAVHPSLGTEEAQAMEPASWRVRKADFDFLISQEARAILAAEGIMRVDYRALQQVWAHRNGDTT
jgi:chitin disaccharide deacetylase